MILNVKEVGEDIVVPLSKEDRTYLDGVLSQPHPEYIVCERCGRKRTYQKNKKRRDQAPLCEACKFVPKGTAIKDEYDETPCFQQQAFWDLETKAEEELYPPHRPPVGFKRDQILAKYQAEVNQEFCGACPLRGACLKWGKDEGYEGFAGGVWMREGKPETVDLVAMADPETCRHGHPRAAYYSERVGKCMECRRIVNANRQRNKARKRRLEKAA